MKSDFLIIRYLGMQMGMKFQFKQGFPENYVPGGVRDCKRQAVAKFYSSQGTLKSPKEE